MTLIPPALVAQAAAGDQEAWTQLVTICRPKVLCWLRQHDLRPDDAEDITQDVLLALAIHLPTFRIGNNPHAFPCWVKRIAMNRLRAHRKRTRRVHSLLSDPIAQDHVPERHTELIQQHRFLLTERLEILRSEFRPKTIEAFRRIALRGQPIRDVAEELNLSVPAVYTAKSRVMKRLREIGLT